MNTLVRELDDLHAGYVVAINLAIEADDLARVEALAAAYDREALELVAAREGKTHLLPELVDRPRTSRLARLAERLHLRSAA